MTKMRICSVFVLALAIWGTVAAALQKPGTAEALMGAGLHQEEVLGRLEEAIATYREVLGVPGVSRALAARAQLRIGVCYERLGQIEARQAYKAVLRNYSDQTEISGEARKRLSALNGSSAKPAIKAGPIIRQIVAAKEIKLPGPPSPDGRYLAFVDQETHDVAILDLVTGEKRRVTRFGPKGPDAEYASDVVWSPKGDQLAYIWEGKKKNYTDLRIIDLATQSWRSIYKGSEAGLSLGSWTPDGNSILARDDKVCGFVLISVKDGSAKPLNTLTDKGIVQTDQFAISPDGQFVAYELKKKGRKDFDIQLLALTDGMEASIVDHGADDRLFGWAPDGQEVFFTSDRSGNIDLWRIRIRGGRPQGEPVLAKSDLGEVWPLGITQNGAFFYSRGRRASDVYVASLDLDTGHVLSPPARVHPSRVGNNTSPGWSADGRLLAYLCPAVQGLDVSDICIWSIEDGSHRQLRLDVPIAMGSRLSWSPGGKEILARGGRIEQQRPKSLLWRIDSTTGRVLDETPFPWRVSPDNRTAFEWSVDPATGKASLFSTDLADGQKKQIYQADYPPTGMAGLLGGVSPDGRRLTFVMTRPRQSGPITRVVTVIPTDGGEALEVLQLEEPVVPQLVEWSADSRHILCLQRRSADLAATELWKISMDGEKPQIMDLSIGRARELTVNPDGKHLAFTSFQPATTEIWNMENVWQPAEKVARPVKKR